MNYTDTSITDSLITSVIPQMIEGIRNELSTQYDVTSGDCERFTGLCDIASAMVILRIKDYLINNGFTTPGDFIVDSIHGEQRHSTAIESRFWILQHTWACLKIHNDLIYIDATCSQFNNIYDDMPDYYVSTIPPKWFYPDRDNPAWRGILSKINDIKFIPRKIVVDSLSTTYYDGIVEFIQYNVWGKISDMIRRFK